MIGRLVITGAVLAAVTALAACGATSTREALLPTAANVSACRTFALTINNSAPLQGLTAALLRAGTSVSYRLRRDMAVFIAAAKSGAAADGLRVRRDCLSIHAPVPSPRSG
jgi:hypothetical protein